MTERDTLMFDFHVNYGVVFISPNLTVFNMFVINPAVFLYRDSSVRVWQKILGLHWSQFGPVAEGVKLK